VSLERLARELDVEVATIVADLSEVTARAYYHPAGSGDDIQIQLESDRVRVFTKGSFQRPVKLSPRELLCLALGLRGRRGENAGSGRPGGTDHVALLERVEAHLATQPLSDEALERIYATDAAPDPDGIRTLLVACARDRARCRIAYLKPAAETPDERVIHPYMVAHAEGRWYVIAWCESSEGVRAFRLDRVLDAAPAGGAFEPREDIDVEAFFGGGKVFDARGGAPAPAGNTIEAVVRYSPAIARWIAEWATEARPDPDGSVVVRHTVADPGWLISHVLAYAGEAEVLEPGGLREQVGRMAGAVRSGEEDRVRA
jgi:proteasome accessory factor C